MPFPHITLRHRIIGKRHLRIYALSPMSPSDTGLSGKGICVYMPFPPCHPPTPDYREKASACICPFPHVTLRHRIIGKRHLHVYALSPMSPSDTGLSGKGICVYMPFPPCHPPTPDYREKASAYICPFPMSPSDTGLSEKGIRIYAFSPYHLRHRIIGKRHPHIRVFPIPPPTPDYREKASAYTRFPHTTTGKSIRIYTRFFTLRL
ncbi:hypothetical protein QUF72_22835 [Desulfobacterales bacterium HSG2]|nr:hypothetical protein [Desulfobacterales bacterium HSG2]